MELETVHPHPNPHPNPHRKIELQSALDLTYLQSNLAASAQQKLDLHFPPNASQPAQSQDNAPDPLRAHVAALVTAFLSRTFAHAAHGISINGTNATSLPEFSSTTTTNTTTSSSTTNGPVGEREGIDFEYEAYDPRLNAKLASLYAELESLTTAVSRLRREVPGEAARRCGETLARALEGDRDAAEQRRKDVEEREREGVLELDRVEEGWREEREAMYELGVGELRRLGGLDKEDGGASLMETVGKAQRARDVAMELE
jgi:kinetochor protein Mis14/NSL1